MKWMRMTGKRTKKKERRRKVLTLLFLFSRVFALALYILFWDWFWVWIRFGWCWCCIYRFFNNDDHYYNNNKDENFYIFEKKKKKTLLTYLNCSLDQRPNQSVAVVNLFETAVFHKLRSSFAVFSGSRMYSNDQISWYLQTCLFDISDTFNKKKRISGAEQIVHKFIIIWLMLSHKNINK